MLQPQRPGQGNGPSSNKSGSPHRPQWPAVAFTCLASFFWLSGIPLRNCPFLIFRACSLNRSDPNPGHRKHPVPLTTVMVAKFLTTPPEPLESVVPEGSSYSHSGLLALDFLQPKDPCQMYYLFNAIWASSGLAQTAIPTSSLDSWLVGFPLHPNPKGLFSQL